MSGTNTYDYVVTSVVRDTNDIVVTVTFEITADDGVDSHTHTIITGVANDPQTPIPFASLTEAKIIEWIVRDAGPQSAHEALADSELAAAKLRKVKGVKSPELPWTKSNKPHPHKV